MSKRLIPRDAKRAAGGVRRTRPWTEEDIRGELTTFLEGWDVWPTAEQFVQSGAKGLREAIGRINGAAWWAREMGVPGGDRGPGGVRRWTDEMIRATLKGLFGDRATWPTHREFDEAGLHALREALRYYGGAERWSREMGVGWPHRRPHRQPRPRPAKRQVDRTGTSWWPKWTEATITAELESFLGGRTEWPRFEEFVAAGRKGLYQAVLKHGGTRAWAARMGVRRVERPGGGGRRWSDVRIRERLTAFLAEHSRWPSPSEFWVAGEGALLAAVRKYGGVERWARELGFEPVPGATGRARRPAVSWTDERIADAIGPLVQELGRWPTKSEFKRAGLSNALAAVYGHGGSAAWPKRFDVEPKPFAGPLPDRRRWSPERIESELTRFCRGRPDWPTFAEFQAAKRHDLYQAIVRHGGIAYWRERFGYAVRHVR